jgi:serine phosphatase RsbU (regulator of sigma subunit)
MTRVRRLADWAAVAAAVAIVAAGTTAFVAHFAAAGRSLIVDQGPLSLQPTVAQELELFFDSALVRNGQVVVHLIGAATFWAIGLVILLRARHAPMRIATSLTLLLLGTALFAPLSALEGFGAEVGMLIGTLRPGPVLWRSAAGVALLWFALVFPDGRPLGRVWTWFVAGFLAHVAAFALFPGTWLDPRQWEPAAASAWTLVPALGAVAALIVRFTRIPAEGRLQIRLVVVALGATIASIVAFWALQPRLESGLFDLVLATRRLEALHDLNLLILLTASLLLLPVAVGISVIRYRLWDVELIMNRALVYAALTGLVAGTFVLGTVGLGSILAGTIGGGRGVAGVVTGVVLMLVFQPVRRRVQAGVDRRFYRQKYDAERAVERFTRDVAELVRPVSVAAALGAVVRQTVQPTDSWVVLEESAGATAPGIVERPAAGNTIGWPDDAVVMVPLIAQARPVGAVYLGPRRSGRPYTALDRRLLERIAAAAAPPVRVGQLVEEQERRAVERARLDGELAVARTIQRDLLPHRLPTLDGWRFAARYESSREVGGDYYDIIPLDDGRLGLLVADVSGKGVPAALVMATCRAVVRSIAGAIADPAEVLRRVNLRLSADIAPGMFVTCFYAVLDPVTATLAFANAGHPLPVLKVPGAGAVELRATGMPFGWMQDAAYDTVVRDLPGGAVVVIASDGVIEARDRAGEFWGAARFAAAVASADGPDVVDRILEALKAHCAPSTDLGDDVTLLALARA